MTSLPKLNPPHPLDNEWRVFGDYYKCCYDVRDPVSKKVLAEGCWPNAGVIHAGNRRYKAGEVEVRISPMHPLGGVQLNAELIGQLERMYGKWPGDRQAGRQRAGESMKKLTERRRFECAWKRIQRALNIERHEGIAILAAWRAWQASARVKRQARKGKGAR